MLTIIYFIRHAESDFSKKDERKRPLTKKGINDSFIVNEYFNDIKIDTIFSSPYKRSIDTLLQISISKNIDIFIRELLRERKIGEWIEDFTEYSKKQWSDFNYKLKNGESLNEVQKRNLNEIKSIISINEEKTIIMWNTWNITVNNY
jgi:2,3-bisphosphoglycerate-dependent phosphoglycerate mutase